MIKTVKTLCTAFLMMTVTFLSAQNLEQYIPKDATFVISMNLNHLDKKVNLLELQQYPFYDMVLQQMGGGGGDEAAMMNTLMTEPSQLGFNVMEKAYFFGQVNDGQTNIGAVMQLTDSQNFMNFLKTSFDKETLDVQKANGFSYVAMEDDVAIAWNDNVAVIGSVEKKAVVEDYGFDSYPEEEIALEEEMPVFEDQAIEEEEEIVEQAIEEPMPESLEEVTEEMLEEPVEEPMPEFDFSQFLPKPDPELRAMTVGWLKENLVRTTENSIQTNPRFGNAVNNNDMHFWMDYSYFLAEMQKQQSSNPFGGGMSDMMGEEFANMLIGSLYKDTYFSMTMNFNKGRWVLGMDQYTSPKMVNAMSGAFDSKYNKKMVKHVRGDELMGIYHINFNMDAMVDGYKTLMKDIAKEVPMYGSMAESALEIVGIFVDEEAFSNIFNGDMIFAVTGMQSVTSMQTVVEYDDDFNPTEVQKEVTKELPEATMMMSYGSEKDLMKFIRLGVKTGMVQQSGKNFTMNVPEMNMEVTMALRDGILFISNSQDLIRNDFKKKYKGKQKIDKNLCKTMCENAQVFYWNIPQTIASLKAEEMAGALGAGEMVNIGKQNFESMMLTTSKSLVNGAYHSEFSLNMVNKETNALKQIFEIVNEMMMSAMGGGSKT